MEWNRRRYLAEAIKTYFNDDVDPNIVVDDIRDVLTEEIDYYRGRADDLQQVMDGINND
jgi:predicted unusual protein kinase regulating ubiquinone biosynthesis (AarF/ABC1/UbiB family)|tara:strand:+ start:2537 stop:2713 length:177 start_codon:yes stop_codon:yes gene_type:complete